MSKSKSPYDDAADRVMNVQVNTGASLAHLCQAIQTLVDQVALGLEAVRTADVPDLKMPEVSFHVQFSGARLDGEDLVNEFNS